MTVFLTAARIRNFRSIRDLCLAFQDVTLLVGDHGVGKTNVLEAIAFPFQRGMSTQDVEQDIRVAKEPQSDENAQAIEICLDLAVTDEFSRKCGIPCPASQKCTLEFTADVTGGTQYRMSGQVLAPAQVEAVIQAVTVQRVNRGSQLPSDNPLFRFVTCPSACDKIMNLVLAIAARPQGTSGPVICLLDEILGLVPYGRQPLLAYLLRRSAEQTQLVVEAWPRSVSESPLQEFHQVHLARDAENGTVRVR